MITPGQRTPIVIATKPVDFRRGHDGLAATVQNELGLDPHSGLTVIFRSKRGDRVKILVWDGTGLVLIYKRLDEGRFAWPAVQDGVMRLTRAQGVEQIVTVTADGFEWQGRPYRSLSAIARAITGTRWNGWVFFGVKSRRART
jgi:transposase